MKKCNKCGRDFPATNEFFYSKTNNNGIQGTCKNCYKENRKQYRENNKDKISERQREYYENNKEKELERKNEYRKANHEKVLKSKKKYREANKAKIAECDKKHYEANRDKILAYCEANKERTREVRKKYLEKNKDKHAIDEQRRRAKKRKLSATLTSKQWNIIKQHFDNRCAYCGKEVPLAQEHFMPLSKGGHFTLDNIIPACKSCNSSKQDKLFLEWYSKFKHYNKERENRILDYLGYINGIQQLLINSNKGLE